MERWWNTTGINSHEKPPLILTKILPPDVKLAFLKRRLYVQGGYVLHGVSHTIKTLLSQGKSLRGIARQLGISRDVVTRIRDHLAGGKQSPPEYQREKVLDEHEVLLGQLWEKGLSAELIHRRLIDEHGIEVSYPTVARLVRTYKSREVSTRTKRNIRSAN